MMSSGETCPGCVLAQPGFAPRSQYNIIDLLPLFHLLENRRFDAPLIGPSSLVLGGSLLVPTFSKLLAKLFKNRGNFVVKQSTPSSSVVKSQGKSLK